MARLLSQLSLYCMFIGHPRSGSTLCGALLSAHPEIVIANELDALSHVEQGISRDQLFALILQHDRGFNEQGSKWQDYDYAVPNQWQGRFRRLKVIGDKKAGISTTRLGKSPDLLPKLRETVRVPIKFFHIIRNPFDNISTMARRTGASLEESTREYFLRTDTNARLLQNHPDEILTMRHEDLISTPGENLKKLVEFLGLEAEERYVSDCCRIIYSAPAKSRLQAPWSDALLASVQSNIDRYSFLQGYSFKE